MPKLTSFLSDESGAVTVDWVVLTAAVAFLGLIIFSTVRPAVGNMAEGIANVVQYTGYLTLPIPKN